MAGREVLRVAVGDSMNASCVACHNSNPASPKTDWKVGDVRGLTEIVQPIDSVVHGASELLWKLVMGAALAGLALLGALLAIGSRFIRPLRELIATIHCIAQGRMQGPSPTPRARTSSAL